MYIYFSFVLKGIFTFLPFIFLSRHLDSESYASLSVGYAFMVLYSSLSEFGFSFWAFQDAAKKFDISSQRAVVVSKLLFSLPCLFLICFFIFFNRNLDFSTDLLMFLFSGLLLSFSYHLCFILRGLEDFKTEFIHQLVKVTSFSILVFLFYFFDYLTVSAIAFCFFLSLIFSVLYLVRIKIRLFDFSCFDFKAYFRGLSFNLNSPIVIYGVQNLLVIGYLQLDAQLVLALLGSQNLALYMDFVRIVTAGCMAGEVLLMKTIPMQIRTFDPSVEKVIDFRRIDFIFVFAIFCTFSLAMANVNIFRLVYGDRGDDFSTSTFFLCILIVYIRTLGIVPSTLLSVSDFKSLRLWIVAKGFIVSLISNLILIPILGIWGAVTSSVLMNIYIQFKYNHVSRNKLNAKVISSRELAVLIMCLFCYFFTL